MHLCERCHVHQADVIFGDLSVCGPCAETMAWSLGIPYDPSQIEHVTGGIGDVTPIGAVVPPIGIAESLGLVSLMPGGTRRQQQGKDDGFPFFRVMLVLGGVAAVGVVGLMAVNAMKTTAAARDTIMKHPELLAGL
jgi:hypothetical protein